MKRLLALLLALLTALVLTVPASADIIWEPEDAFYEHHREECSYAGRHRYLLAGYSGTTQVWSAPNGVVLKEYPNGLEIGNEYQWTGNGVTWGYVYGFENDPLQSGWVAMDDLTPVMDGGIFFEAHEEEIVTGDPVAVEFTSAVLYAYPGGPAGSVLEMDGDYMPFSEVFSSVYIDGGGLRWGYLGYYMGRRNEWVCLDDPMNEHLDTNIMEPPLSASQQRGQSAVEPSVWQRFPLAVAAVLVLAVVVATLLLIRRLRPRKKEA